MDPHLIPPGLAPAWGGPLSVAILIGILLGLEIHAQPTLTWRHGGRTLPLITVAGFVTAFWWPEDPVFIVGLIVLGTLLVANYVRTSQQTGHTGMLGEMAAMAAWLLGGLAAQGDPIPPLALTIGTLLLLGSRRGPYDREMDKVLFIRFAILGIVIALLLPNQSFSDFQINPREVWAMVVLVTAIATIGYVGLRFIGPRASLLMLAICGGMVSSTAVVLACARISRVHPETGLHLIATMALAVAVMAARQLVEVAVVQPNLLGITAALLLPTVLGGIFWYWHSRKQASQHDLPLSNPLDLVTVLQIAGLYLIAYSVLQLVHTHGGVVGIYLFSLIAGVADVDAITLALAQLHRHALLPAEAVPAAIAAASMGSVLLKIIVVRSVGTPEFARRATFALLSVGTVTAVVLATYLFWVWRTVA